MLALEGARSLDHLTSAADGEARALAPDGFVRDLLTGRAIGHALHPVATDLPLGFWTSASLLDLVGGDEARASARRLVGLGVLTAPAAVLTGWAEWRGSDLPQQRVGVVHAALNASAVAAYAVSWALRPRRHRAGVVAALVGASLSGAAGFLGGHLASGRQVATRDRAFVDPAAAPPAATLPDPRPDHDPRPDYDTESDQGATMTADQQDPASMPPATATAADLVAAVSAEHGRYRTVFDRLQLNDDPTPDDVLQLKRTVARHAALHSEVLAACADTAEARDVVGPRMTEDEGMAQQIQQLERMDVGSPTFRMQLGSFGEALEYHLAAQLSEETPLLADRMSPEQRALVVSLLADGPDTGVGDSFADMAASARMDARQKWST